MGKMKTPALLRCTTATEWLKMGQTLGFSVIFNGVLVKEYDSLTELCQNFHKNFKRRLQYPLSIPCDKEKNLLHVGGFRENQHLFFKEQPSKKVFHNLLTKV